MDFEFAAALYYNYFRYKENLLTSKRIKYIDISKLISKLDDKVFLISKEGESYTGRDIKLISTGKGKKRIFMWSQMHGDESTATMALFDIFNFLAGDDGFNSVREKIFKNASLYFLPMVNPDGAEEFKRGNYIDIDINRDAKRLQSPEGRILRNSFDKLNADFAFNLHDQNIRYTAGNTDKTAAISFLAPLFDQKGTINITRGNSIRIISGLTQIMNNYIPGHISKYEEEYEPRSFGDTFQGLGASTILVESGGWRDDREKQFIRKLNFILLLSAIKCIIDDDYQEESTSSYNNLPFNKEILYDLVLRNLTIRDKNIVIDIGINNNEEMDNNEKDTKIISSIEEIGDLSNFYGNEEYNLTGCELEPINGRLKIGGTPEFWIKKNGVIKYKITNGNLINPYLN
jgi:hypothetical protein